MNEAVFKTAVMGGFSKSEVLAFIDKQDAQFKAREKELMSRIDSLNAQLKKETQHNGELCERISELESELNTERARCDEAIRKLEAAHAELGKTKNGAMSELDRRNAEIERLKAMVNMLNRKVSEAEQKAAESAAEAEASKKKLELIDKSEEQIGKAILEAQKTADNIISAAKEEAEQILNKARGEAQSMLETAKDKVDKINAEAQEKLDAMLAAVEDYVKVTEESRTAAVGYFNSVDSMFAEMHANAEKMLSRFSDAFKRREQCEADDEEIAKSEAAAVKFDFSVKDGGEKAEE